MIDAGGRVIRWGGVTAAFALAQLMAPSARAAGWMQLQGDAAHTGYSAEPLGTKFTLGWRVSPGPLSPNAQPIVADGKVLVGTSDGEVVAFDAMSGKKAWGYATKGAIRNALASDGERVFAGSA